MSKQDQLIETLRGKEVTQESAIEAARELLTGRELSGFKEWIKVEAHLACLVGAVNG